MTRTQTPSPPSESTRKRGRIACTACRQAKVRCDFVTIPCTRCTKLAIDCSVDPGFKRTNQRDKVSELQDNVQRLRTLVEKQQPDDATASLHSPVVPPGGVERSSTDLSNNDRAEPVASKHHIENRNEPLLHRKAQKQSVSSSSRSLGNVTIYNEEIGRLFAIFFERFHPFLPILNPRKSPSEYYDKSPVLFWTIIAVALRSYKQDSSLLMGLTPSLTTLLWTEIGSNKKNQVEQAATDVTEIQAVLLLATWPLPGVRLWSDRSLVLTNMALTSAMHLGLHRPGFDTEYARNPTELDDIAVSERSAIWVACYTACISWGLEHGHTPLVPVTDWLVNTVCSRHPKVHVPQELRHLAIIQRQVNDAFQILAQLHENPAKVMSSPLFFPHLAAFEKILPDIGNMYASEMSLANRVRSQGNILMLQQMYFLADQALPETKQGILRAYATATNIITLLITDDETNNFLASAPYILLRIILRAGFTMLRTLFSCHGAALDRTNAKILYNAAALLLRSMSFQSREQDQPVRVAEALKSTWTWMEKDLTLLTQPPTVKVRTRFGASIGYDCLLLYRDARKNALAQTESKTTQQTQGPTMTPASVTSILDQTGTESLIQPSNELAAASFEELMAADLAWIDSFVYQGLYSSP